MINPLPPFPDPATAQSEPLLTVGTITGFAVALVTLLIAFGIHLTGDQRTAILGVVAVAAPFVTAVVGRTKVYSPRTVVNLLAACRREP